jgi:type I restriction enzyme S subunit
MSKLKEGYKKTKVGVIPQEWEKLELSKLIEISKLKFNPKNTDENKKCIELEHISQDTGKLLGNTNSNEQQSIKNVFKKGQILFGKLRPYLRKFWRADFDGVCSTEIWVLEGKNIINDYLFHLIQTNKFNQIANVSSGSKMPRADWKYMAEIPFNIPPLKKQQKIAEILTTWDKAISKQEELIKAKEKLKKGLMQKLLSREVRFKEFHEEWEEVRLGDIGIFKSGFGFPENQQGQINQKYPFYKVSDMNLKGNEIYMKSENHSISKDILKQLKGKTIPKNSIIFAKVGAALLLNRRRITVKECCLDNNMMAFIPSKEKIDIYFIYCKFLMIKFEKLANIGALPSIGAGDLKTYKIVIPPLQEQQKIAQVLSTADKEIELLKHKLEELKKQKKGLMQRLLSGEVRVKV